MGIDQQHLEAAALEQFEQWDPVDTRRLHRHGANAALFEPLGQTLQIGGEGGKLAHRLLIAIGGDGNKVAGGPDIDAGGIPVQTFQLGLHVLFFRESLAGHDQGLFLLLGEWLALLGGKNHTFFLRQINAKGLG
jgi:hypothetical protein